MDSFRRDRWHVFLAVTIIFVEVSSQRYDGRFMVFDKQHDRHNAAKSARELDERLAETVRRFLYERGEYDDKFDRLNAKAHAAAGQFTTHLSEESLHAEPTTTSTVYAAMNATNSGENNQLNQEDMDSRLRPSESVLPSTPQATNTKELYAVVRVLPEIGQQLAFLERLERDDAADLRLNFWTSPVRVGSAVDVMVPYDKLDQIKKMMKQNDLQPDVIIEDVEKLIIERERKLKKPYALRFRDDVADSAANTTGRDALAEKNRRSLPNVENERDGLKRLSSGGGIGPQAADAINYDFHRYGSYAQMVAWMRALAHRHPDFIQFISIGKTHEGRSIDGLEIGTRGLRKRAFWIDGGIHAREWAAPHTALYFIHQLTSRYGQDANVTRLVTELTWIIIPLLNPDGYEYTRLSTNPNVRLWRKNRAPTQCVVDQWGRNRCCKGVDLNRNFDFHFKESGSSDDPCSEIYQGKGPFSEPEARAVRDAILSSRYRSRVDGFITLHTYSQIWIHPYGHKKDSYPGDVQDLYSVGKKATVALSKLYGTKYILGSGADTLYPASGGSEDWAKESAAIKFVYLIELRPDEQSWDGFILDETKLIPTASETWAGIKVVAEAIIQRAHNRVQPTQRISGTKQYRFGDGTPGSCYDLRHACKRWIQESETLCTSVPVFMREQCAYSCGYC